MLKASIQQLSTLWKPYRNYRFPFLSQRTQKFSFCNVSLSYEHLNNRSLIRVSGEDASDFLQGLITNDIRHLQGDNAVSDATSKAMYCMFLDARGRVILDSIIYKAHVSKKQPNEVVYFLECDSALESTILKHLKMYKLRKKVDIAKISDEMDVWVEFNPDLKGLNTSSEGSLTVDSPNRIVAKDPRLPCLGLRHLCQKSEIPVSGETAKQILESGHYTALRYSVGIGEGIVDHPPGSCFPLEANGDYLHGVSFHKGCYVGQELTARTHHTGVVRKRLMPLIFPSTAKFEKLPEPDTPVIDGTTGKNVGKIRGMINCGGVVMGLGLLRVAEVLKSTNLKVADSEVRTLRPFWWPEEAPKDIKSSSKS
ncbi:hypothetical protein J437_LFUL003579 [Ladona fulva]|uniref:CAF17 C-terminal domain-containing protein n=1 Tax=Ladona fulva TaxID=123851 RepID=A0A8K0JZN4_LADFU|nr:hypothetical protein J437_LFUL003579 [Ladona fulva]